LLRDDPVQGRPALQSVIPAFGIKPGPKIRSASPGIAGGGRVGGHLDRAEAERNQAQDELRALNEQLEQRVIDRTRQLRERNEQMEEDLSLAREFDVVPLTDFP
jgi:hypothetical protein